MTGSLSGPAHSPPPGYEVRKVSGQLMQVHTAVACDAHERNPYGPYCPLHHPSRHPLASAPLHWRGDRRLWERICVHGIGHPDPDDLSFKHKHMSVAEFNAQAFDVHGCCGICCVENPERFHEDEVTS